MRPFEIVKCFSSLVAVYAIHAVPFLTAWHIISFVGVCQTCAQSLPGTECMMKRFEIDPICSIPRCFGRLLAIDLGVKPHSQDMDYVLLERCLRISLQQRLECLAGEFKPITFDVAFLFSQLEYMQAICN